MKRLFSFLLLNLILISLYPQSKTPGIVGNIIDNETKRPVSQATVQLLSAKDMKFIGGAISDAKGHFKLEIIKSGDFVVRFSYVGYKTQDINVKTVFGREKNLGTITLVDDAVMLGEAVVTGQAPPVRSEGDTLIFNASSYKVTDGAVLEELVEKLPGVEIDDDNKVKLNGQKIKKINVNGKEFFGGDVETALKNLPVDMIEEIKSYDKQSDMEKMTGIDDGNDELVLDIKVKKSRNHGFFGNTNLAMGTDDRYTTKLMANRFREQAQFSVIGSTNNINNNGFRGGGKEKWQTNKGLTAAKSGGVNLAFDSKKVEFEGSVDYRHTDKDYKGINSSQHFLSYSNTFSNSNSLNKSKFESFRGSFRLEWKINDKTTLLFRPSLNYDKSDDNQFSNKSLFNKDPLLFVDNPNDYLNPNEYITSDIQGKDDIINLDSLEKSRVNYSKSSNFSQTDKTSASGSLMFNRKLSSSGRNIGLQIGYGYNDNNADRLNNQYTTYCLLKDEFGNDSTYRKNYYIPVATNSWNYSAKINYSEPLAKSTFLQFSYQFLYRNNTTDRHTYDFHGYPEWELNAPLPDSYTDNEVARLGKSAVYDYYNHNISTTLRIIKPRYNISFGVSLQPQYTVLSYDRGDVHIETDRNVFNYSPQINIRYKFTKYKTLRFMYHGRSSQPGMEQLLPITDDTNPLNIRVGNPDLAPSFSHDIRLNYNSYDSETQRSLVVNTNFSMIQNSLSNSTIYNEQTGGQIVTPQNINGDWNGNFTFGYNSILINKSFHINSNSSVGYNNNVGFLYNRIDKADHRNRVTDLRLNQRLGLTFRSDWLELGVNGSILYSFEKNKMRPQNNQEPYLYSYGSSLTLNFPWKMNIITNIVSQQRCGYSDKNLNRNEIIWNAQMSQRFFKGSTILSVEVFDILKQKSNVARSLSANLRSITQYNSINNYAMFHFIYKLNIMGGKRIKNYNRMRTKGGGGKGKGKF